MAESERGGTVLRGEDGTLYFVRDQALADFEIKGEGLERMQGLLSETSGGDVAGFDFRSSYESDETPVEPLKYVSGDLLQNDPPEGDDALSVAAMKSVMCPWFC